MNRRAFLIGAGGAAVLAGSGAVAWRSSIGSMADYDAYARRLRAPLAAQPQPQVRELIRYATLAANSHNTQPWRFRVEGNAMDLMPDYGRRTSVVDPDDHHLFVSLGCAAENLAIAAAAAGRPGEVEVTPSGVRVLLSTAPGRPDPLFDAIPKRQSTRADYDGRPVSAADLAMLERAAAMPGVRVILVTERARIGRIRDLVVAGNHAQMADPAFLRELKHWLRFNPRSAAATGDGLFSAVSGNPVLPTVLGGPALDLFFTAQGEGDRYARQIDSSAGLAIFVGERADREHWMRVGRACQRFALTATSLGLKHAFVNQPVEVAGLRGALAALIGEPGRRPDLVMRFGHGPTLPFSPRRPVDAVLA
ncbi:nitroreductase family protein [Sphingomonas sp. dw_22]|uniref:Acg family FMN-binding oxidoreductase n=1 Tax=Sphingomonas sp. dw_22 TaxID=2721175 RepID=UPI001BD21099|nr:nitroreductase family protein [Sphingomonas sp. dw_22]